MVIVHVLEGLTASHSLWFLSWLAFACERSFFFFICLLKKFCMCSIVLICCVFCCFFSFVRWLVWEWASWSPSVCAPGLESWYRPHSIWDISTHQPIQLARLEQSELWEQWVSETLHIMVCRVSCSGAWWGGASCIHVPVQCMLCTYLYIGHNRAFSIRLFCILWTGWSYIIWSAFHWISS